jgi:hypothetical protein
VDVLNELFDKEYKQGYASWGKSTFWFGENRYAWFAPIGREHENWRDTLTPDMSIEEEWLGGENRPADEKYDQLMVERAIFAKQQNALGEYAYRFIGIYRIDQDKGSIRVYKQVSKELPFSQWLEDV